MCLVTSPACDTDILVDCLYGAVLCWAVLCWAVLCWAVLCWAVLCWAVLCWAVLCWAVLGGHTVCRVDSGVTVIPRLTRNFCGHL